MHIKTNSKRFGVCVGNLDLHKFSPRGSPGHKKKKELEKDHGREEESLDEPRATENDGILSQGHTNVSIRLGE